MRFVKLYRRIEGKFTETEIIISFYSSSSTSNQWRKLKNLWFPGKTIFCPNYPSCFIKIKKIGEFTQLTPRILYLAEPDKLKLPSYWDSQDLLSLYGQYLSTTTLVDHMDVKKASDFFDQIRKSNLLKISFCCYFLPSFYFCFLCVPFLPGKSNANII
nr:ribosomal protein L10 [Balanophora laxiflora]